MKIKKIITSSLLALTAVISMTSFAAKNSTENLSQNQYCTSTMLAQAEFLESTDIIKDTSRCVPKNEYEALSVAIINQSIVQQLPHSSWYMFKHYIAAKKSLNTNETLELSIVDNLENRGRQMNRQPFDFELLGAWQSND